MVLHHIHKQPKGVRQTFFVLSLIITFSLIGTVWAKSFQNNLFVLLNPKVEIPNEDQLVENGENESIFASIGETFKNLKAQILDSTNPEDTQSIEDMDEEIESAPAREFPIASPK